MSELAAEVETPLETPVSVLDFDNDIPNDFLKTAMENDPELRELDERYRGEKATPNKNKVSNELPEDVSVSADPLDKKKQKVAGDVPEDPETDDEEFGSLDFEDNVIPGVLGEDLKKIGSKAALALAEYRETASETETKYKGTKEKYDALMSDPVIRARADMLSKGQTTYAFQPLSENEKATAISKIADKYSLTKEEAYGIFDDLKNGFEAYGKDVAESHIHNRILETDTERRNREVETKARGVFLDFGKINPKLSFKETNPDNFWISEDGRSVLNERHPEIDKFKEKILPVMSALAETGMTYHQIAKMSEKFGTDAVYALAAKTLGLPVAINTSERDRKMITSEVKKRLKSFLKADASDELNADGASSVSSMRKEKGNMENGIDLDKLIDNDGYFDAQMRKKPEDPQWMDYISDLQAKAIRIRRKKK